MDSLVNQLARELTEAIAAAVADDARVEACREKARAAGLDDASVARGRDRIRQSRRTAHRASAPVSRQEAHAAATTR